VTESWIYREPSRRPRRPPTEAVRLPQPYAHGYDQTAHLERLGLPPAQAPVTPAPRRPPVPTFTPVAGMPPFGYSPRPQAAPRARPSRAAVIQAAWSIAVGLFLGLVVVGAAFAALHFRGL
jgi:hypothetical protein